MGINCLYLRGHNLNPQLTDDHFTKKVSIITRSFSLAKRIELALQSVTAAPPVKLISLIGHFSLSLKMSSVQQAISHSSLFENAMPALRLILVLKGSIYGL